MHPPHSSQSRRLAAASLQHPWLTRIGLVLLVGVVVAIAGAVAPALWRGIDERSTDLIWRWSASEQPERRIVIVDIDDASLAEVGPWPWSRPTLAKLVRELDRQGVGLKLFDIVLPEPREGDATLGAALRAHDAAAPTVLGQVFAVRHETTLHIGRPVGAAALAQCPPAAIPAQGVLANAAGLHKRAGHVTPIIDSDGTVRRIPALVCYRGAVYPALALAGLAAVVQPHADAPAITLQPGSGWDDPAWWLGMPGLPHPGVALDADGALRIPFHRARQAWTAVSAADVLGGRVPPGLLQGAWVIVGASAFGLSDTVPTALGGAVFGAEVHAQLLAAMLDGSVPHTPRVAWLWQAAYGAGVAVLLLVLCGGNPLRGSRRVLALPVLGAVAAAAAYVLHALLLLRWQLFVGWAWPAVASLLLGSALGLLEHARSLLQKGRIFHHLASYVPSPVAEQIALQPPSDDIQAQRAEITVLAADVRNFSAYCEARTPEDVARVLHRFYTTASAIVAAHGGVVEEMVGDSLLAVFNGPLPCPAHAQQALLAAREIWLRCGEELPNTMGQGLEPLAISVGVETGVALVGSFGAAQRRVHTVLGQTVTVALRLRDMTADLAYPVLVGQGTAQRLPARLDQPDTVLKPLGNFLLPGLRNSSKIYTLRGLLQPHTPAEQQNLDYLHQKTQAA